MHTFLGSVQLCDESTDRQAPAAQIEGPMQVARRSDMDMNGHINNVTYLGWALETVPADVYLNYSLYQVAGLSGGTALLTACEAARRSPSRRCCTGGDRLQVGVHGRPDGGGPGQQHRSRHQRQRHPQARA